jgi:hypothetical protein
MSEHRTAGRSWRQFGIGNVVGDTFTLFFRHLPAVMGVTLVIFLPTIIHAVLKALHALEATGPEGLPKADYSAVGMQILQVLVLQPLTNAMLCLAFFHALRERPITVGESARAGLGRVPATVGVVICQGLAYAGLGIAGMVLIFAGGFMVSAIGSLAGAIVWAAFSVLGVWLVLWVVLGFYVAVPITVVERIGPIAAMSRSLELCRGVRLRLFFVLVLVYLVPVALAVVSGVLETAMEAGSPGTAACVSLLTQEALTLLMTSLGAVSMSVCYYHLRCAKEGLDVETLAAAFDAESPAQ